MNTELPENKLPEKRLFFKTMYGQEVWQIDITLRGSKLPKDCVTLEDIAYNAGRDIEEELFYSLAKEDPEVIESVRRAKETLNNLFPAPIFVEEIPNEYSNTGRNKCFPWFVVTTTIGRFKIGSRKQVIHIEWTETVGTERASLLFPDEKATKGEKYIHAWSTEDAKRYIDTIFQSVK